MAKIAVDIDDTLYSFGDLARKVLTEKGFRTGDAQLIAGAYAPWPEWRSPVDFLGLEAWLNIIAECHLAELILCQRPYDGAVETLMEVVDSGHELLYISNRATETQNATQKWLMKNSFPGGELVVTSEAKKPFVADCQYLIDDRPKTLIEFVYDRDWHDPMDRAGRSPRYAFALTKEYNRGLTDVPRIYLAPTWYGIRHYLLAKLNAGVFA